MSTESTMPPTEELHSTRLDELQKQQKLARAPETAETASEGTSIEQIDATLEEKMAKIELERTIGETKLKQIEAMRKADDVQKASDLVSYITSTIRDRSSEIGKVMIIVMLARRIQGMTVLPSFATILETLMLDTSCILAHDTIKYKEEIGKMVNRVMSHEAYRITAVQSVLKDRTISIDEISMALTIASVNCFFGRA